MVSSAGRDGNEAMAIHGRADRSDLAREGSGQRGRSGQAARGEPIDDLRIAQEVWTAGHRCGKAIEGAGASERTVAQAAGRSRPRDRGHAGDQRKKVVSAEARQE